MVLLTIVGAIAWAAAPATPAAVRQAYLAAAADARAWPRAWATVSAWLTATPNTAAVRPRLEAYRAALRVLRARDVAAPWAKLTHLRAGMHELDRLVVAVPDDPEIRLLRFLSVVYLPRFLGYADRLAADAAVLARRLPDEPLDLPPDLQRGVYRLLLERGRLEPADRARVQAALQAVAREGR